MNNNIYSFFVNNRSLSNTTNGLLSSNSFTLLSEAKIVSSRFRATDYVGLTSLNYIHVMMIITIKNIW